MMMMMMMMMMRILDEAPVSTRCYAHGARRKQKKKKKVKGWRQSIGCEEMQPKVNRQQYIKRNNETDAFAR